MPDIVPFGKYKNQPLATLQNDPSYCEWLLEQGWFVERYPAIHTLVINHFGEPSETPEHNALQIRLLDDQFRANCTELALQFFDPERYYTHEVWGKTMQLHTPYFTHLSVPTFEYAGIDVSWTVRPCWIVHLLGHDNPQRLPDGFPVATEK
jgi:hypothetical protein